MLKNVAEQNLHVDKEIRAENTQSVKPTVIDGNLPITTQPKQITNSKRKKNKNSKIDGSRKHKPKIGYELLKYFPSVYIEQTFMSVDSFTSENRFFLRSPLGKDLYAATECATEQHSLWRAEQLIQIHLHDQKHQNAMIFRKIFTLGAIFCQPNSLEVLIPPENLLGCIVQSLTFFRSVYYIKDATGQPIFSIEGPQNSGFCCFYLPKESIFKIYSAESLRASIERKWVNNKSQYITFVNFIDSKLNGKRTCIDYWCNIFVRKRKK